MTTQDQGRELKDAYRRALATGTVARYLDAFRRGAIVRFPMWRGSLFNLDQSGFDVTNIAPSPAAAGEYQLHYYPTPHALSPKTAYGVFARMQGSTSDEDWIPVDGPWQVDKGPFDNERKPLSWQI